MCVGHKKKVKEKVVGLSKTASEYHVGLLIKPFQQFPVTMGMYKIGHLWKIRFALTDRC